MKKSIVVIIALTVTSCARYEKKLEGVKKVCPTCTFVDSENRYYACDTSKQPNIVYRVWFMPFQPAVVKELTRIN